MREFPVIGRGGLRTIAATACLACCTNVATLAATPVPLPAGHVLIAPTPSPMPNIALPPAESPALTAFEQAWAKIVAYSATVTIFELEGDVVQNSVFDYTFRKPSIVTIDYKSGKNAGVSLLWKGGDAVVARRGSGLFALFSKTFSLHDPTVMTIRGSSIDQLSFGAILAHAKEASGIITRRTGPEIDGVGTESLTLIPTTSALDAGMTAEIIDISATNALPIRVLGYEGATLVRQLDFSNIKLER